MGIRKSLALSSLVAAVALCVPALHAQPPAAAKPAVRPAVKAAAKPTANDDLIKLAKAGMSEDILLATVADAKSKNLKYDTSADALVALKDAGISQKVIAAILGIGAPASTSAPATQAAAPAPPAVQGNSAAPAATASSAVTPEGSVPPMVASEAGLYYSSDQGIVRIEAKTPYQTRTGSTMASRLTLGIKPARLNAMLMGLRSDLQVSASPKFYMHLGQIMGQSESIGEYYLVKFTVKESGGRREIEIGSANFTKFQAGFPEKDLFQMDAKRLDRDIYLLTPKSALSGGEYGILQLPQGSAPAPVPKKIFDFGVR